MLWLPSDSSAIMPSLSKSARSAPYVAKTTSSDSLVSWIKICVESATVHVGAQT